MAAETNNIFIGTELKLNINIEPMDEFTMDDYDWLAEVYCSTKRIITISKSSAIRIDSNNYVLLVDSNLLGAGDVKVRLTAYIPDFDFPDTLRSEVSIVDTGLKIVKTI